MRRLLVLTSALAVVALVAGSSATAARQPPLTATGYAMAGSATPSDILRDGSYLRIIGVDGVTLDGPDAVTSVDAASTALRRTAQKHHRKAILLVSNYSDTLGDFDEKLAHRMLTSSTNRASVVEELAHEARLFDGLQIDLESLKQRDLDGLTVFTRELREALPGKSLSMAFMASTNGAGYRARGYDLPALGAILDRMILMAYDQHGPWSGPGPVGSMPWVRRELAYFAKILPNAKIDLGVAAYGYQWKRSATLTVAQARSRAGSKARWSTKHGEWHASLGHGRTIWWSDKKSLARREKLARSYGLHGVSIWQIGSSGRLK